VLPMVTKSHIDALKEGHLSWHKWRKRNPYIRPNLSNVVLDGKTFHNYDFSYTNFEASSLRGVNAHNCYFYGCNFRTSNLMDTEFKGSDLRDANFIRANLTNDDLTNCRLHRTTFRDAKLNKAILTGTKMYETMFVRCDLSSCIGLDSVSHIGPSVLDFNTIRISKNLPINFLRGCGLPEKIISYLPEILGRSIDLYSCFISYSSQDDDFVRRLHADLQDNGVRCWFAPHDMPIGAKILDSIDEAIRLRDKVLLILSATSITSEWVEGEVTRGLDEERQRKQTVLLPIRVDDAVMQTTEAWARLLRGQRHIGDFTKWKEHDPYSQALQKLLSALNVGNA
jgi:hypothetical protein